MQLFIVKILLVPSANAHQSPRNRQNGDAYHQKITADMMLFYRNIWVMYDEFGAKHLVKNVSHAGLSISINATSMPNC